MSKCMTSYAQGTEEQEAKNSLFAKSIRLVMEYFCTVEIRISDRKKTKIGVADNNLFLI